MRIVASTPGRLVVRDTPGLHWCLGALFVGVGIVFTVGPLGLFTNAAALPTWVRAVTLTMGLVAVVAGVWVLAGAPCSTLRLFGTTSNDRAIHLARVGVAGRRVQAWPATAIASVAVVRGRDDEGGAMWQVRLVFRDGTAMPVSPLWAHDRRGTDAVARAIAGALGVSVRALGLRAGEPMR